MRSISVVYIRMNLIALIHRLFLRFIIWISALVSPFLPLIEDNLDFSPSFLEINRIINCEFLYNSKTCSNKMRKFCLYIFYSNDRSLHSLGFEIEGTQ